MCKGDIIITHADLQRARGDDNRVNHINIPNKKKSSDGIPVPLFKHLSIRTHTETGALLTSLPEKRQGDRTGTASSSYSKETPLKCCLANPTSSS
jgi:hypothetical protein